MDVLAATYVDSYDGLRPIYDRLPTSPEGLEQIIAWWDKYAPVIGLVTGVDTVAMRLESDEALAYAVVLAGKTYARIKQLQ